MEHKIGEIFKYNGEWYQCIKADPIIGADGIINYCERCAISASECDNFNCIDYERLDKELVIFKKLEKVGEPFKRNGYMYQEYKAHTFPLLMNGDAKIPTPNGFAVIIKQNKEDMEEKKQKLDKLVDDYMACRIQYAEFDKEIQALYNKEESEPTLKEFDLEAAKAGKPVCTRDGRKAIFLITLANKNFPLVAIVSCGQEENIYQYDINGICDEHDENLDLMMLPEKKEGWVNVYKDSIHATKEEALNGISGIRGYIDTVKISWEE